MTKIEFMKKYFEEHISDSTVEKVFDAVCAIDGVELPDFEVDFLNRFLDEFERDLETGDNLEYYIHVINECCPYLEIRKTEQFDEWYCTDPCFSPSDVISFCLDNPEFSILKNYFIIIDGNVCDTPCISKLVSFDKTLSEIPNITEIVENTIGEWDDEKMKILEDMHSVTVSLN